MPRKSERALEAPHDPPADVPLWSENFAWLCHDAEAGAGILLHLGRMPHRQSLWRSTVIAYLPDGQLVVSKAVTPCPGGALGTGNLTLTCREPMREWALRFVGVGRPTSRTALGQGRLVDAEVVPLEIDLSFTGLTPVWDLGAMGSLGDTHYEQHGRFTGTITAADRRHGIDASGYRDHSTGTRDLAGLGGHVWTHALFPSGRAFCAFRAFAPDGTVVVNDGILIEGDQLTPVSPVDVPVLTDPLGGPDSGAITLEGHNPITATVLHSVPISLGEPNDFYLGYDADLGRKVMVDCPARFEWNGEMAFGWLERSAILP
ncbi:hypothetical protein ACAG26_20415 [Mycobacterium sp. pUA109]|uniref:hypothetical protein n=1 Tax=Mycobacterium sp. pUA109 TaxID=3238982 RepID=UPI00351B30CB